MKEKELEEVSGDAYTDMTNLMDLSMSEKVIATTKYYRELHQELYGLAGGFKVLGGGFKVLDSSFLERSYEYHPKDMFGNEAVIRLKLE